MKGSLAISLLIAAVWCLPIEVYKEEFEKFKVKFHKSYATEEEEAYRLKVFSDNYDQILEHNELYEHGQSTYKLGVTNFTDFTHQEFLKWLEEEGGMPHHLSNGHSGVSTDYILEFNRFKEKFNKTYVNKTEEEYRFSVFSGNLDQIEEHNKRYDQGLTTYKQAVTNFTDMTRDDFLKWLEEEGGKPRFSSRAVLLSDIYTVEFEKFKAKFHKTYNNESEENHRLEIFSENFDKITEHNKLYEQGQTTYTMQVTNFTDMTHDEFLKWLEEEAGHHPFGGVNLF